MSGHESEYAAFVASMRAIATGDQVELFAHYDDGGGRLLTVSRVTEDVIYTAAAESGSAADWVRNGRGVRVGCPDYLMHPFIRPTDGGTRDRMDKREHGEIAREIRDAVSDLSAVPLPVLRQLKGDILAQLSIAEGASVDRLGDGT